MKGSLRTTLIMMPLIWSSRLCRLLAVRGFVVPLLSSSPLRRQPTFSLRRQQRQATTSSIDDDTRIINLSTTTKEELETVITAWGYPKYRATQVWTWIRRQGVTAVEEMSDLPKPLRLQLQQYSKPAALKLEAELVSKDGTIKRAYACADGQVIESVLMPYQDGRYTACISSQAGCAQGCVFCGTGQMGFSRVCRLEWFVLRTMGPRFRYAFLLTHFLWFNTRVPTFAATHGGRDF